jgi:hypothetical protein
MSNNSQWEFFGAVPDGQSFRVGGLDVWKHEWRDTKERLQVKDPRYQKDFTFHVYEIGDPARAVTFAAGEFSNCIWGFYIRRQET